MKLRNDCDVSTRFVGSNSSAKPCTTASHNNYIVLDHLYCSTSKSLCGTLTTATTGATKSGRRAFEEAGLGPEHVDYASIYDSFTITVLAALEDLGFCEKGDGGTFVEDGALEAPDGELPFNTDGGGLCSNHPGNRGGMTKVIEAVRQLRGEANPEVQVDADIALAHGTGGSIASRHGAATVLLGEPIDDVGAASCSRGNARDQALLAWGCGGSPTPWEVCRLWPCLLLPALELSRLLEQKY